MVDNVPGYRLQKCSVVVAVFLRLPVVGPLSMKRIIDLCCRDGPCYLVSIHMSRGQKLKCAAMQCETERSDLSGFLLVGVTLALS